MLTYWMGQSPEGRGWLGALGGCCKLVVEWHGKANPWLGANLHAGQSLWHSVTISNGSGGLLQQTCCSALGATQVQGTHCWEVVVHGSCGEESDMKNGRDGSYFLYRGVCVWHILSFKWCFHTGSNWNHKPNTR
jgi:hypothetical protein